MKLTKAEKATRTRVDTIMFSRDEAASWPLAPFQRPLTVNDKVRLLAEQIGNDGGVIPGMITKGVVDALEYLLDGQHRREAFLLSGKEIGYADVRTCFFESMADMGEEFVHINSHLVNMKPDDILRGLEGALPLLGGIRRAHPFVGYGMIRRGDSSPIMSMSTLLRCWAISAPEVPASSCGSATTLAGELTKEEADGLVRFLDCASQAWGRDVEYRRLWTALNLSLCMWLYRRLVQRAYSAKTERITDAVFTKCLMSLSANAVYLDWLTGRHLGERDRSPAYNRIKMTFARRLQEETGRKPLLPAPAWAHGGGGADRAGRFGNA